jgi:hypothetical protein
MVPERVKYRQGAWFKKKINFFLQKYLINPDNKKEYESCDVLLEIHQNQGPMVSASKMRKTRHKMG